MDNKKRLAIQGVAALIQNANFKGLFTGRIYQGGLKSVCVPGLNCYSCPGAVGACPIGSLQNSLSGMSVKIPYYVLGLLIFFGALLGRAICGFICPFGLLQDLLNKIPFVKKIRTFRGDRQLRKLKYAVLIVLVIIVPICVRLTPAFCKYVCPSGTLSGILLSLADSRLFSVLGAIFTWKVIVLILVVVLSILIYRPFCKYICPLGAVYAPFNKVALLHMSCDSSSCVSCGACASACGMGVDPSVDPNDTECIRCGSCIKTCSAKALSYELGYLKTVKSE
ncbi:MAG: 4Fe-4S binding protein [Firmicutes bacterium]|nr:4Fe-4S binding protein [Bacillota bacterium]